MSARARACLWLRVASTAARSRPRALRSLAADGASLAACVAASRFGIGNDGVNMLGTDFMHESGGVDVVAGVWGGLSGVIVLCGLALLLTFPIKI